MEITVNLQDRNIVAGTVMVPFNIDDYTAWRLLEGLDDIGLTLRKLDEIESYEAASAGLETAHSAGLTKRAAAGRNRRLQPRSRGPRQEAKGGKRIAEKFASYD